jgi:hypothetical protein
MSTDSTPPDDRADAPVVGFMCLTNYWHELGQAPRGGRVYSSLESLRANRSCVAACGIVEVEVRLRRVVQEPSRE